MGVTEYLYLDLYAVVGVYEDPQNDCPYASWSLSLGGGLT